MSIRNNSKGYTLLELCIVLAVSGIISLTALQVIKADVVFKFNYLNLQFERQDLLYHVMDFYGLMMQADDFTVENGVLTIVYHNPETTYQFFFFDNYLYRDGMPYLKCKRFEVSSKDSYFFVSVDLFLPNGNLLPIKIKGGGHTR